MNKRANLYLNIIGFISFILAFSFFYLTMKIESMAITIYLYRNITFLLTSIFGLTFILVEIILFMLYKNKYKTIYIVYMILDILITFIVNDKYPFTFPITFILFRLVKDIIRITKVNIIYIPRRFNKYCKMFNIEIKDFDKKKVYKKKKKIAAIPNKKEAEKVA